MCSSSGNQISPDELSALLQFAQENHKRYEKELGKKDKNWADWYAKFILRQMPLEIGCACGGQCACH